MKRKTRFRFFVFREYETAAFAEYMEEMARKGWYLKTIYSSSILCFVRGEARNLKFCTAVLPDSSQFDDPDREEAQRFREYCREAGWKLQYGGNLWQVFYSEEENPLPIETDPQLQLAAQRANSLSLGKWAATALLAALFLFQMRSVFENPGKQLASNSTLIAAGCMLLFTLAFPMGMAVTFFWYRKAQRCLERGIPVPFPTLRRVKLRNFLSGAGSLLLILTLTLGTGLPASSAVIALTAAGIAILVCALVLAWVQTHGSGDRMETATGYFVGAFVIGWVVIMLVTGILWKIFPSDDLENRKPYVRREPFPVTFEALGYPEAEDEWRRVSDKSVLSFYQMETWKKRTEDGKESRLTMEYYKSPLPVIVAGSKNSYPGDWGNVWEVTASKTVREDGITVDHYHYVLTREKKNPMIRKGSNSDAWDLYVISDRNRILTLEYSTEAEPAAVEAAVAGFCEAGGQ